MKKTMAIVAALSILAAACGSRVDQESATEGDPTEDPNGESPATSAPSNSGTVVDEGGPVLTTDPLYPEDEGGQVYFGDIASPCGEGDGGEPINLGTLADPGGLVPGLNQELMDGAEGFMLWCNAQGGINGRELVFVPLDAKLGQYRERIIEACDSVFALVGGGAAFDYLGAQEAVDCGLLEVPGFTVSPEKWEAGIESGMMFSAIPNASDTYKVGSGLWIAEEFPGVELKAANMWGTAPVVDAQAAAHQEAYESIGFEFVYTGATPLGAPVSDYNSYVAGLRDAGVEYFTFTSTWEELANFQRAMDQQDFRPTVFDLESNYYNKDYAESAADVADGSFIRISTWPFEEASESVAMSQYLAVMNEFKPDGVIEAALGVHAFSATLLFATAASQVDGDLTREAVVTELQGINEWTGGGLHGSNDPGNNESGSCFIVMEIVDGGFQRRYPLPEDEGYETDGINQGFACPANGVATLD